MNPRSGEEFSGGDPERTLDEFWTELKQLLARRNDWLITQRQPRLRRKDIADAISTSPSTFNDWWTKGTVPDDFGKLALVAKLLGGDYQQWLTKCRRAHAAYERLPDGRRGTKRPVTETRADQGDVRQLSERDATKDGPDRDEGADHPDPQPARLPTPDDQSAGTDIPPTGRRRWSVVAVIGGLAVVTLAVVAFFVWGLGSGAPTSTQPNAETRQQVPDQPASLSAGSVLCAFVDDEPAWIFTAPRVTAPKLRQDPKPMDSGITIVDRSGPPGWTRVLTPRNNPKYNWMQSAVLSRPYPYQGSSLCPDRN